MLQGLFQTEAGNLGFPTSIITKVKGGGVDFAPRGIFAMSGDILRCHSWGVGGWLQARLASSG